VKSGRSLDTSTDKVKFLPQRFALAAHVMILIAFLINACGPSAGVNPTPTPTTREATVTTTRTPEPSPTASPFPPTATPIPFPDEGAWGDGPLDAPVQLMVYSNFQ
jgi:hypothetical protein